MGIYGEDLQVYPLTEQWVFRVGTSGISGTRVYLNTTKDIGGNATKTSLPTVGSAWDSDYTGVTLKDIEIRYVNDNDECGRKFICYYDSTTNVQKSSNLSEEDLPIAVEITGETISWFPKTSTFQWKSDLSNIATDQAIHKYIAYEHFKLYRVVHDFETYMSTVMGIVNKVNSSPFKGFPAGMVIFNGANLTEFKNKLGNKRWRVELSFTARNVTDNVVTANENGWNYILRDSNGQWDKPQRKSDAKYLYDSAPFDALWESDVLGDDEDLFQAFPSQ